MRPTRGKSMRAALTQFDIGSDLSVRASRLFDVSDQRRPLGAPLPLGRDRTRALKEQPSGFPASLESLSIGDLGGKVCVILVEVEPVRISDVEEIRPPEELLSDIGDRMRA